MAKYIYLISVLQNLKVISIIYIFCASIAGLLFVFYFFIEENYDGGCTTSENFSKFVAENIKVVKFTLISTVIALFMCIAIPERDELYMMLISNHVTIDNYKALKEEVKEGIDYLSNKLDK